MRRFEFRPHKIKISGWLYNGVPLDGDTLHPAILCATEEDADLLLQLLEDKVQEQKDGEFELVDAGVLYQVFDNDRAADENGFPKFVGKGWTSSIFKSLDEARIYLANWLNVSDEEMKNIEPDIRFDYSGHGDYAEIKTLPVKGPKDSSA